MHFYLDADLSWRIAGVARDLGLDVISANQVEMRTAADAAQLSYSTQLGRCIVTNNRDDFIELDRLYQEQNAVHAGILIRQILYRRTTSPRSRVLLHTTTRSTQSRSSPVWLTTFTRRRSDRP